MITLMVELMKELEENMSKELKQERSIPVQGRIDIKSLAEMDAYWSSIGVDIRTMSQLISWTVDLCHDILSKNDKLPVLYESVADCHNHLERRNLYQKRLKERSIAKVNAAMRFESLRLEGVNPAEYDKREYNIVHNKNSVEPYQGQRGNFMMSLTPEQRAENERQMKVYREIEAKEMKAEAERQKANAMKSGKVVVVEHEGETTAERNERLARENSRRIEEDDMMPPGYDEE